MSSEPTDKKPRAKKTSAKKTSTKEPAGPPVPPFGDLDNKALRKLAAKLAKNPNADYF